MTDDLASQKTDPDLAPLPASDAPAGPVEDGWLARLFIRAVLGVGLALVALITVAVTFMHPGGDLDVPVSTPEGIEAARHLFSIHEAQKAYFADHGLYTRTFTDLGVDRQTQNFRYRVYLRSAGQAYVAYARWKDPAKSPRKFLQIDADGAITENDKPAPRRRDASVPADRGGSVSEPQTASP